ncbi:hypothetical protein ACF1B0_21970 [Streptomyces anandii]|uniref:hypothetical protein n=1 Tax=Streptomyces anandii TaxID=285454 RepID=UPI0036F8060E
MPCDCLDGPTLLFGRSLAALLSLVMPGHDLLAGLISSVATAGCRTDSGHPAPLLIRDRRLVPGALQRPVRLPLGPATSPAGPPSSIATSLLEETGSCCGPTV